jgi:WD40 repeat protein
VRTLDFDTAGDLLASGSVDGAVRVWWTETGELADLPFRHNGWVEDVAFRPHGSQFASASRDGTARVWNVPGSLPDVTFLKHNDRVWDAQFTPDGGRLVTIDEVGGVYLWDAATRNLLWTSSLKDCELYSLVLSRDGESAFFGGDVAPHRLSLAGVDRAEPLVEHGGGRSLAISPDGRFLAAADIGGGLCIVDLSATVPERVVRRGESACARGIHSLAYSPGGAELVVVKDGLVEIWDPHEGVMARNPLPIHAPVEVVAFEPDGDELAVASQDGTVQFWNARSWEPLGRSLQRTVHAMDLAYGPEGRILATIDKRGIAQLWEPRWGLPAGKPMVHGGHGHCVAISPDRRRLATGTCRPGGRVWDLPEFMEISVEMMELRTWVALGARLGPYGAPEPIPWYEWQEKSQGLEDRGLSVDLGPPPLEQVVPPPPESIPDSEK